MPPTTVHGTLPHPTRTLAATTLAVTLLGCTSWDDTRAELVEPIQKLLHQEYPRAIVARDADVIAGMFPASTSDPEPREAAQRMLADWTDVENATCVLEHVELVDTDRLLVDATVRIDGRRPDGARASRTETQRFECLYDRETLTWGIASCERLGTAATVAKTTTTFADEAAARGLNFHAVSAGVADRCGVVQDYLPGSGLGVGDLDDDERDDVVLVRGRAVRAFVNLGDGTFEDQSDARGFGGRFDDGECRFALVGDLDADGDRDVFVGRIDAPDAAFFNDGDGTFTRCDDLGAHCGIVSTGETMGACLLDIEGDGDLDLFLAGGANLLEIDPDPVYGAENAQPNRLFRNDGTGQFEDISAWARIDDTGWALACTTGDVDLDGDTDIYVANDFGRDRLYLNDGNGRFTDAADDAGITWRGSTMGVSLGDLDADGDVDIFATGMASNSAWLVDQPGFPAPASWLVRTLFRPYVLDVMREMFWGNRCYLNRGDGTFEEVSLASGTRNAGWAWGGVLLDYDHDGRLDVYVPNGLWSGQVKDDL